MVCLLNKQLQSSSNSMGSLSSSSMGPVYSGSSAAFFLPRFAGFCLTGVLSFSFGGWLEPSPSSIRPSISFSHFFATSSLYSKSMTYSSHARTTQTVATNLVTFLKPISAKARSPTSYLEISLSLFRVFIRFIYRSLVQFWR